MLDWIQTPLVMVRSIRFIMLRKKFPHSRKVPSPATGANFRIKPCWEIKGYRQPTPWIMYLNRKLNNNEVKLSLKMIRNISAVKLRYLALSTYINKALIGYFLCFFITIKYCSVIWFLFVNWNVLDWIGNLWRLAQITVNKLTWSVLAVLQHYTLGCLLKC